MKNKVIVVLSIAVATAALLSLYWIAGVVSARPLVKPNLPGGVPAVISYQGQVVVSGSPYEGNGYFKFAIVNLAGTTTYWSNDGTSSGGNEPGGAVQLTVSDGLFSVLLGDTTLAGMTQALTATVFNQADRYLRVWFSTSASDPFSPLIPDTRIAAVPYALQAQKAVDADTLDGMHANELAHFQNVIVVAKSGGDFPSVHAAIDSINDATADNPYLIWVAPGVYMEQLVMKPHVHLQGAGQEVTVISSTASSPVDPGVQATLVLTRETSLRDLTVYNGGNGVYNVALSAMDGTTLTLVADVTTRAQGGGDYNYAVYLTGSGTDVTLQQVTALAEAENTSSYNYGLYNTYATVRLHGGSFTARGGSYPRAIYNTGSGTTLEADNVAALAEDGVLSNYGLFNSSDASATLRSCSFTARGGAYAYGIHSHISGTTLNVENTDVLAENGSDSNHGLYNYNGSFATLLGGTFTARGGSLTYAIHNEDTGTTLVAESVNVLAQDGSTNVFGLYNYGGAEALLRGGSFTARGGEGNRGIFSSSDGTQLNAESISALGEDGSNNYGLYISYNSTASVTQSVLAGATNTIFTSGTVTVTVSNSRLAGSAVSGSVTCVAVSRGTTFNALGCP
jgi:hypothetical protein